MLNERERYFKTLWERLIRAEVGVAQNKDKIYTATEVLELLKEILKREG